MSLARHGFFAAALLALAGLYAWLTGYDDLGAFRGDGLIYLQTARHYAPHWPDDPIAAIWADVTQFPPAYALLLAASGGIFDFRLAHFATTLCLLAAFAMTYAWLLTAGVARTRAAAAAALVGIAPGTFLQSLFLHPEGLYVALCGAALLLLVLAERSSWPGWLWCAAAAIAAAILTRTVGIALLPALAAALVRARTPHWPLLLAVAILPGAAWNLAHRNEWSYSDTLTSTYLGASLESIVGTIRATVVAAATGLVDNLVRAGPLRGLAGVLAGIAGAVTLWRLKQGRPDAWYVASYLVILALWPYPQEAERLAWVLVPFVIGYVAWAGERLAALAPAVRVRMPLAWLPLAVLALALLPEFALLMGRALHPLARATPAYRHHPEWYVPDLAQAWSLADLRVHTARALRRFEARIPQDACVFTTLPYVIASFYVPRDLRVPPAEGADDETFGHVLRQSGCAYVLFTFQIDPRGGITTRLYPLERLAGRVEIVDEEYSSDGKALVAALGVLRPDAAMLSFRP